jgi:predicted Zn-dependent protease
MILNEEDAKKLLEKILKYSKADSIDLTLKGSNSYNLRFAINSLSTDGFADSLSLFITSNFGKKSGSVSLNKFSNEDIRAAIEKSEKIAAISPDNNEFMPPLTPQTYLKSNNYSKETEIIDPSFRASQIEHVINESMNRDLLSAGFFEDEVSFTSVMNSNGLFAYNQGTMAGFSTTVRTKDGTGSSRAQKQFVNVKNLNTRLLSDTVIERSMRSINPKELSPGKYTVILEPAAVADMVTYWGYFMDARSADEGRSFFSKTGGGNKIGEALIDRRAVIYSDPTDVKAPSIPFNSEGVPRNKTYWFENGVLINLMRGRFWAQKMGQPVVPYPSNLIMEGTNKTLDEIIASTNYGILVTRFWYIRTVDPRTILLTGLTRDGLFEIRDGKIIGSVKNFRFNESPINMLSNILDIGKAENAVGSETGNFQLHVPALKIKDFNFSSLSDAI